MLITRVTYSRFDMSNTNMSYRNTMSRQDEDEEEALFPTIVKDTSYSNVIIVEGLPITDKKDKLEAIIKRLFSQQGTIVDFYMPVGDNSTTKGCDIIPNFFIIKQSILMFVDLLL